MVRYPTVDELIYINEALPGNDQIHKILKGRQKVRDMGLLEAAAARPQQSVFGADAYPTLAEKAAALLHSIARNHPFADGNKRTAALAALFLLAINGQRVVWDEADALEKIVAMAEGRLSVADFAAWLAAEPAMSRLEPDAEADMRLIAALVDQHRWLLAELARR
jgi:death-on-curing protein